MTHAYRRRFNDGYPSGVRPGVTAANQRRVKTYQDGTRPVIEVIDKP